MSEQVRIEANIRDADKPSRRTLKLAISHQIFHRRAVATDVQIEIQNLFPHGNEKTEVALLAGIFLGNLQLDRLVRFLQPAEEGRDRLARLEINRPIFDLDDYIAFEGSIERMKDVVCGSGSIILGVAPIEMMVIDKRPIKKESAVRSESTSEHVGCVGGSSAVNGRPSLPFGISFDDETHEVGDLAIDLVDLALPPVRDVRVQRIKGVETVDRFRTAQVDRKRELDAPRAKHIGDAAELRQKAVVQNARIGVDVVYVAAVHANGSK